MYVYCQRFFKCGRYIKVRQSKQDAAKTKSNIIAAAVRVFMKKGVAGASLEDIASAAKVTRGAIYWHFKNKADILKSLVDENIVPLGMIVKDIAKNPVPDSLDDLKRHVKNIFCKIFDDKKYCQIFCVFLTRVGYSEDLKSFYLYYNAKGKEMSAALSDFFAALQKKKIIKDAFPASMIAHGFFCYFTGLLIEHFKNAVESDLKKSYPNYVDMFFSCL